MTTKKELEIKLRNEKDKMPRISVLVLGLCIGILFFMLFMGITTKSIDKPNIIPQDVCVNQTEQVYECANWTCGDGLEVDYESDYGYYCYTKNCFWCSTWKIDESTNKVVPIMGNPTCKDNLYKLTEKITQNCTIQKEVCSNGICDIKYKK